jgi:MFS-type transporter involved in bile tolerance (Atg22 family)
MVLLMFICTLIGVSMYVWAAIGLVISIFVIIDALILFIVGLIVHTKTNKKKLGTVLSVISVIVTVLTAMFIPTLINIIW